MNLKKTVSLFLICALLLVPITVCCADTVLITSVGNGDVIYNEIESLSFSIGADYDVTVLLNGEKILEFVSEGDDVVDFPKELSVGKQKMTAVAIGEEETLTQEIDFEVMYRAISDTDTIYTNQEKLLALEADAASKAAGNDADGNPVVITRALFDGKDGTSGGAVGFKTSGILGDIEGAKHIHLPLYFGSVALEGVLEIEYDVKIEGKMRFELETKGSGGAGNFGTDNMINNGKIAGSIEYVSGQWYHIKHVVDLENAKQDLYVDGQKVKSQIAVENSEGINTIKVQARGAVSDVVSTVAIDNFVLGYPYTVSVSSSLSYKKGDGYVLAENNVIAEEATAFRLALPGAQTGTAYVSAFADGEFLEKVTSRVDEEKNIDFTLSKPLPSCADIKLLAELGDYSAVLEFETQVSDFGISDISFNLGTENVYITKQLSKGGTLTVGFEFYNRGEEKTGVLVATLYKGNTLVDMDIKNVPSDLPLTLDVPQDNGEYTVECYLFDSLPSHKPLSKIWHLSN